ncbi:MAG: M48 family metallopeptidase [Spirochaetaceae bacterium]|jgi:predicted metal-dependent hydrolase|nr:M48 family metallopeptidase [Spirochaetaceae bacterium]
MTEWLLAGDIPIEVVYKPVKNIRLTVYPPDGKVRVSAPYRTSPELIRQFAASRRGWIEKCRDKYRRHALARGENTGDGFRFVWGVAHQFEEIERRGHPKIVVQDRIMRQYVRPESTGEKRRELLDAWYRKILRETAPGIIEKWSARIGVEINKFYVQKMKSHWGSCNHSRKTIRLNSELVKRSPECLEYVILHELIHIIEPSHNRNFYRLMNAHMPQWKSIRKQMNAGDL